MNPDLDLQLKVAVKSLGDTIGPAIDPSNQLAREQFGLILATLAMVRDHLPVQRGFVRRQLEGAIRLAEAIDSASGRSDLAAEVALSRTILGDPEAATHQLEAQRGALSDLSSAAIAAFDNEALQAVRGSVLSLSQQTIERNRAWFAGAGFETEATDLRPLDQLLKPQTTGRSMVESAA